MDKEKVAIRLVELRGNRTQRSVANAVGIGPTALSMYESGMRMPRDDIKIKLANYYNKEVQEIFFD